MPSAFVDVQTAIIDSECVAWDPEKKQILPFQVLTTRKKKDVDAKGRASKSPERKLISRPDYKPVSRYQSSSLCLCF